MGRQTDRLTDRQTNGRMDEHSFRQTYKRPGGQASRQAGRKKEGRQTGRQAAVNSFVSLSGFRTRRRRSSSKPEPKRRRKNLTKEQVRVLEEAYAVSKYPQLKERARLRGPTSLTEARIQVWFQNRRAKERREGEARHPGNPDACVTTSGVKDNGGQTQEITDNADTLVDNVPNEPAQSSGNELDRPLKNESSPLWLNWRSFWDILPLEQLFSLVVSGIGEPQEFSELRTVCRCLFSTFGVYVENPTRRQIATCEPRYGLSPTPG